MGKQNTLKKIKSYAISNYRKLNEDDFILGEAPINYCCHLNSVQKVKQGLAEKVILCFAVDDDGSMCVHFINQTEDGKYVDHTWGWLYEQSSYYYIREVDQSEYSQVGDILYDTKKSLINLHSNWFERKVLKVNYEII